MGSRDLVIANVLLMTLLIGSYVTQRSQSSPDIVAAQNTSLDPQLEQRLAEIESYVWRTAGLCYYLGAGLSQSKQAINAGVDQLAFGRPEDLPSYSTTTIFQVDYTWAELTAMPFEQRRVVANQWVIEQGKTAACPPNALVTEESDESEGSVAFSGLESRVEALEHDVDDLWNAVPSEAWPPVHVSEQYVGGLYAFDPGYSFVIACVRRTGGNAGTVSDVLLLECERHR